MKLRTRIMALILAMVLCISMSATGVYAEESPAEAVVSEELVVDHTCEEHDETATEPETVPDEDVDRTTADAVVDEADVSSVEESDISADEPEAEEEAAEQAGLDDSNNLGTGDTAEPAEELVDEAPADEVSAEEVTFQSYADTLWSDGTTVDPTIWYGEEDDTVAILTEVTEYYSMAFEALDFINEERASYGLDPVVMDEVLLETAMHRAAETTLYWAHQRPNGGSFTSICPGMIRGTGENIGYGCLSAEEMIAGWMSSMGHRANIIYSTDVSIGVGCIEVDGYMFWVMNCSEGLYKEASASDYTDRTIQRVVHATTNGLKDATTISVSANKIAPNETASISVKFNYTLIDVVFNLPPEGLIYSSTDTSVCTVSDAGVITGVGEGSATIIAYYPGYEEGAWEIPITVCVHSYTSEVTTAPKCNAYGVETYTCSKCGDSYTLKLAMADHTYDDGVITTEMSCMSSGVMTYTCTGCGRTKTSVIEAPYTHSYDDGVVATAPTCVEDGIMTYTCTVCGKTKTDTVFSSAKYCVVDKSEGTVARAASCTLAGVIHYTCSVCGNVRDTTTIPALGHSYDAGVVTTEPTCTEDGIMTYTCQNCGGTKTEAIASAGEHNYSTVTWSSVTCESSGMEKRVCACGASTMVKVDALGHDIVKHDAKAATCTEAGYAAYETCSRCDYSTYAEISASGHAYDGGKTTKNATCTETGVETYTCTTCGASYTESVAALGHSVVTEPAVAPTCDFSGCTEKSYCSRCGTVLVPAEEVPATGHDWDDGVVTKEASAAESGIMTYTCGICSATRTTVIPALGEDTEDNTLDYDVNADGTTDSRDVIALMKHVIETQTAANLEAADTNGDGSIDILDVIRLVNYLSMYGDVDLDSTVETEDASQILLSSSGQTSVFDDEETGMLSAITGDVNGDGAIDARDATQVSRYVNGLSSLLDEGN